MSELRVNELFVSLQGEGRYAGSPTSFVRLQGCNLRCRYCDTQYAQDPEGGFTADTDMIVSWISAQRARRVCITGGEPLLQRSALEELVTDLQKLGFRKEDIEIETNGSIPLPRWPVRWILDIKTPASGEQDRMFFPNLLYLTPEDDVKFVVASLEDCEWSKAVLRKYPTQAQVLFSPVWGEMPFSTLASWCLGNGFRMQLQLHKIIWGTSLAGV